MCTKGMIRGSDMIKWYNQYLLDGDVMWRLLEMNDSHHHHDVIWGTKKGNKSLSTTLFLPLVSASWLIYLFYWITGKSSFFYDWKLMRQLLLDLSVCRTWPDGYPRDETWESNVVMVTTGDDKMTIGTDHHFGRSSHVYQKKLCMQYLQKFGKKNLSTYCPPNDWWEHLSLSLLTSGWGIEF